MRQATVLSPFCLKDHVHYPLCRHRLETTDQERPVLRQFVLKQLGGLSNRSLLLHFVLGLYRQCQRNPSAHNSAQPTPIPGTEERNFEVQPTLHVGLTRAYARLGERVRHFVEAKLDVILVKGRGSRYVRHHNLLILVSDIFKTYSDLAYRRELKLANLLSRLETYQRLVARTRAQGLLLFSARLPPRWPASHCQFRTTRAQIPTISRSAQTSLVLHMIKSCAVGSSIERHRRRHAC